ncbi:hypothetical protein WJX81_003414 [Elliptochloris bilobata]|uniref:Uncharacterized protein n=1 Tax=Elliptochloris bilobata TaxID=381761 RepID=A0AAW1RJR8_9CHLO
MKKLVSHVVRRLQRANLDVFVDSLKGIFDITGWEYKPDCFEAPLVDEVLEKLLDDLSFYDRMLYLDMLTKGPEDLQVLSNLTELNLADSWKNQTYALPVFGCAASLLGTGARGEHIA